MKKLRVMRYLEHSQFGGQVIESDLTLDELVDLAIAEECWGLTYSVLQENEETTR